LELVGDEDPRLEPGPRGVRRDGVREVAGGRATDGIEPERGGGVDRGGHHTVLERERGMRHGVVLHPHPRDAEAPGERRGVDQRREPRVERPHRIAVERQPLLVAPQRGRPAGDGIAVRQQASRIVNGVEGAETRLADRGRGGGALGTAAAAAERPGGERRGSDGSRHMSLNKKTRATTAAGGRFLAPCLTWRQYAANHHESSIVELNNTRPSNRPQPEPPPPRSAGSRPAPAPAPPAPCGGTPAGPPPPPARPPSQPAPRCAARRAAARQRSWR